MADPFTGAAPLPFAPLSGRTLSAALWGRSARI